MSTAELRSAIASGALAMDTQVSRAGFDGWVRAGDVPELFPRTLTPPPPHASMGDLPEPPAFLQAVQEAYEKDGISLGEARPALPTIPGHAPPPDEPRPVIVSMAPETWDSPGRAPAPTPGAGVYPVSSSKPTLMGVALAPLPPPPDDPPLAPFAPEAKTRTMRPLHAPHLPMLGAPAIDASRLVPPPPEDRPLTLKEGHENPTAPAPTRLDPDPFAGPYAPPKKRPTLLPWVLGAFGVVTLIGVVALAMAVLRPKPIAPPQVESAPSAAASGASAPSALASVAASASASSDLGAAATPPETAPSGGSLQGCKLEKPAAKIAPRASKDVPVELSSWASLSRVAVGFSPDGRTAAGVSVDDSTLASRRERVPKAFGKLRRVVPLTTDKTIKYAVDVDITVAKKTLPVQRIETIAADPSYMIGVSNGALVTLEKASDAPKKLFTIPGGSIDAMRSLPMGSDGAAIAVRASGAIYLGLIGDGHSARGELGALSPAGQVGAPSLGTNGSQIAAVFAWRASATDPWALRISIGAKGSPLPLATPFTVPTGGPGGDVFAPSISGLAGGRWLLTWTEGSSGARVVRVATLAPDGQVQDNSALALSPASTSAGQASAVTFGTDGVMVVFLTSSKTKNVFDLWASSLRCP